MLAAKHQEHVRHRDFCFLQYLSTHGATPQRVAMPGIIEMYCEMFAPTTSLSRDSIKLVFAGHLHEMLKSKQVVRGPRPERTLSLPGNKEAQ